METLVIESQEQADSLVVDNVLKFDGHIVFKCAIKAGWSIKAGEYIEADWSIEAGESIKAGEDFGISCGMSFRISMQEKATITCKSEPKNILLGKFVKLPTV